MSMYDKMKERAIPLTDVGKSENVVKTIPKGEAVELFRQLQPVFAQNKEEYNRGLESIERLGSYYKVAESPTTPKKRSLKKS